ncbi:MAG: PAS domain S-box protein, partial [Myxococcales bacterium]|nr:PAS domain S-box protein [Myxococcales bacterium]
MTDDSRRSIFIVEDEALIAMELADHLANLGYRVCGHAARGAAALQEIPSARPDLIILDINLAGGVSGIEVAKRLRGRVDAPILFLTAYSDGEIADKAARTGSYAYLVKPYQPEALRANIELALCKHDAERRLREANEHLARAAETMARSHALLEASFQATGSGLAVVEGGAVKKVNHGLLELWRTPDDLTDASDVRLPEWMRAHVRAPAGFDPLAADARPTEIELRDGRVLERAVWPLVGITGHMVAFRDVTRQRRAELALRESEELHRALFEQAPVGLAIAQRDGAIVVVNPAMTELVGAARSELRTIQSLFGGASEAGALPERVRDGAPVDHERWTLQRRDGDTIEALVSLRPMTIDARPATLVMIEDVTERTRHEEALRVLSTVLARPRAEDFFAIAARELTRLLVVDAAMIAVNEGDTSLRILGLWRDGRADAPRTIERSLACPLCQPGSARHVDDLDVARARCQVAELVGADAAVSVPLLDTRGGQLGVITALSRQRIRRPRLAEGVLQLFAARIAGEVERKREMQRFHDLFELSPDAILVVGDDGLIRLANRRAITLFGYTREELIGTSIERLIPEDTRDRHVDLRRRFRAEANPRRMGSVGRWLSARDKDGALIPVDIALGTLGSIADRLVIVTIRDVRERVKIESARRALEVQLRESQRMETLGALAGGVAHDFNNLLTVIVANVECLKRDLFEVGSSTASVDAIAIAASRATSLVQRILSFSGRHPARPTQTSLGDSVREVAALLRPVLPAQIGLLVEIGDDVPLVCADPTHIHQVVVNLVTNASHAIGERYGQIALRVEAAEDPSLGGRCARLIVRDDGEGIAAEHLDRIFEPFFTTKPAG